MHPWLLRSITHDGGPVERPGGLLLSHVLPGPDKKFILRRQSLHLRPLQVLHLTL